MSESDNVEKQKRELTCMRLAAQRRTLAAVVATLGLRAHFLRMASVWEELASACTPGIRRSGDRSSIDLAQSAQDTFARYILSTEAIIHVRLGRRVFKLWHGCAP